MNKTKARSIADKSNEPLIRDFYKKYPLDNLFTEIKKIAKEGLYVAEYKVPAKFTTPVIASLCEDLQKKYGYDVTVQADAKSKYYVLTISWA